MIHDVNWSGEERDAALDSLVRRYWHAIYAFIRRTGRDIASAARHVLELQSAPAGED